jgi:hypothetical protein
MNKDAFYEEVVNRVTSPDEPDESDLMTVEIIGTDGHIVSITSVYAPVSSDFLAKYVPMTIKAREDYIKYATAR